MPSRFEGAGWALLGAALFVTGATALAAEVVFNRLLRYVFGSSHEATATVLAAYMTGLSAGAYLFGRLSSRIVRPIAAYGFLELAVALFYAITPAAYGVFRDLGVASARALADEGALLASLLRFVLSFGFVAVPTLFMGGTLPLLMAALGPETALSKALPRLYAANTLGAAIGTLLSAYALIGKLGLDGTLALCAVLNLLVALFALSLSARVEGEAPPGTEPRGDLGADVETGGPSAAADREGFPETAIAPLAFSQGAIAFALEVVWTHLIGTVIGVTVYAFATMLAAMLFGIGLGSALVPFLRRRLGLTPARLFIASEALLALCIALALPLWDRFPDVVNLGLALKPWWSFAEREAVRLAFCLALLLPSTLCLGVALPALPDAAPARAAAGRLVGSVFAANTLGAILGALITGFALLGRVPSQRLFAVAALSAMAVATFAQRLLKGSRSRLVSAALAAGALGALGSCAFGGWEPWRLTAGSHYYWTAWRPPGPLGQMVFFAEDAQSGFVTVERDTHTGARTLKTNGKYESADVPVEFQDFLALIGAMYLEQPRSAFLVGLGGGRTLAMLHEMPFRRIEVAEHSPAIVRAAREQFSSFVSGPLSDGARVRLHLDDGRNRLQLSNARYDLVLVAISGAAFAGSSSIYSRDFFDMVRSRLEPGGVFLLWLQLHHVRESETRAALNTLRRAFPHVHLYTTPEGAQGFAVASSRSLEVRQRTAEQIESSLRARLALQVANLARLREIVAWNVFNRDDELLAYLSAPPAALYTDMNPGWEFETPRGLATKIAGLRLYAVKSPGLPRFAPPLEAGDELGLSGLRALAAGDARAAAELLEQAEEMGLTGYRSRLDAARRAIQ